MSQCLIAGCPGRVTAGCAVGQALCPGFAVMAQLGHVLATESPAGVQWGGISLQQGLEVKGKPCMELTAGTSGKSSVGLPGWRSLHEWEPWGDEAQLQPQAKPTLAAASCAPDVL